ncbi:unnamed protein product [Tetraodon nigroviridis]|uniref:(spotted green pufferfish) hypothetical protein n=1 Tax=Tetraodon nigroviridis TaxID=99883 RepID=Q4RXQ5_TETNG|nr:unnamed protein product [Tetraodon nigroviridis]
MEDRLWVRAFGRGSSVAALLLVPFFLPGVRTQLVGAPLDCRSTCVCASNIISCSRRNLTHVPTALPKHTAVLDLSFNAITRLRAEWTPVLLGRLRSLLLANNGLTFLSSEAFVHVTGLRHLDLSCNGLRQLDEYIFEPLEHLEVLLLYNNNISQIDRSAFSGLFSLQKLYLSQNQISRLPVELVKERSRLEALSLLDVSGNRIKNLPLQELQALPAWIKNGLYFHNNPLPCSCHLYEVVARWRLKGLSSIVDFELSHTCVLPGPQKHKTAILDLSRAHLNCSEVRILDAVVYLEQFLVLDCDTRQKEMEKSWTLPGDHAVLRRDGGLQIGPMTMEDSGVYTCYATSDSFNETLYSTVVVLNSTTSGGLENLKTAYTTLAGCLISIVMVLVYLYLTPCQCPCCPGQGLEKSGSGDSLHSSALSVAHKGEVEQQREEGGGFGYNLETKDQLEQNGRLNPINEGREEWRGDKRGRRGSEAASVSSETPMMV